MDEMMWMRMPGQTWPGVAASFVGMWIVMMAAMMLPSLVPMLWRYQRSLGNASEMRRDWLTAVVAFGCFFIWTVFGVAAFPLGVALSAITMREPIAIGAVVLIAGVIQFTNWKTRRLASCAEAPEWRHPDAGSAFRHGLRLGVDCAQCCVGLMTIPLVLGMMDLRVMVAVTAAITAERLAPAGVRVARINGVVIVGLGLLLIASRSTR